MSALNPSNLPDALTPPANAAADLPGTTSGPLPSTDSGAGGLCAAPDSPLAASQTSGSPERMIGAAVTPICGVASPGAVAAENAPAVQGSATPTRRARRLPTGPLFVWLLIQVGALALAAGRVPLAARYPTTGERYALDVVLAAQAGFAAMLFPWILRDLIAAVMAIASCWPVLALAVMLSALKPVTLLLAGGYISLWLAVLTAWRFALRSEKSQMIATAVAVSWVLGGPVVWYLRAEFNSPMQASPSPGPFYGPLTGALAQVEGPASDGRAGDWLVLAVLLILGLGVAWIVTRARVRRSPKR